MRDLAYFLARVSVESTGCWTWTGRRDRRDYGRLGGRLAHRVAYDALVGPIPTGLTIDHLCFNPPCVNPEHLRLLTLEANQANQRSRYFTHCKWGHAFDEANTYLRTSASAGARSCRACNREAARRYKEKRIAA